MRINECLILELSLSGWCPGLGVYLSVTERSDSLMLLFTLLGLLLSVGSPPASPHTLLHRLETLEFKIMSSFRFVRFIHYVAVRGLARVGMNLPYL